MSGDSPTASESPIPAVAHADAHAKAVAALEESLGTLFRRVRASWKDAAAAIAPGLQPIGYKILSALVHAGPTPSGCLAETLTIDKSVLSRQVRVLEELELVASHADPSDGRARILEPTPLAVERVRSMRSANRAMLEERLSGWTPAELEQLVGLLDRLSAPSA